MKAYITCPVLHSNKRLDLLPEIKKIVEQNGIDPFVFMVGGTPKEIFKRDYNQLKQSDIVIAEVSERSHGVGIEIGIAHCLGLKKILLLEKGQKVTKLAQGMPDLNVIEYSNIHELKQKLNNQLQELLIND